MISLSLSEAAKILQTTLSGANATFTGISSDSRTIQPGNLFVAIEGPQFNGHDYLQMVADKGAIGAIVSQAVSTSLPTLKVSDTILGLGALVTHWRAQFHPKIIALTGSNGKTSTKSLIQNILSHAVSSAEELLASEGTQNNEIGVPMTLAKLHAAHRYAVIEMGMNHPGEIARLVNIAKPHIALITNVFPAHLEGLGSLENIAKAKAEIFSALSAEGIGILNHDDAFYAYWQDCLASHRAFTFGLNAGADVTAAIQKQTSEYSDILLKTPKGSLACHVPLPGNHNVMNVLSAVTAVLALEDVPLDTIKRGIESWQAVKGRLNIHRKNQNLTLIDDTYNANPGSTRVAIQMLAQYPGHKILVLGDMRELGSDGPNLHAEIGAEAKKAGIDQLFAVGELSLRTCQGFGAHAYHFADHAQLIAAISDKLKADTTILVKGSRSMRMEQVVKALLEQSQTAAFV